MEIKVGIVESPRELTVETEISATDVEADLAEALSSDGVLKLTEKRGRIVLIPAARISYLDLGSEQVRPVGFGAL